MSPIYQAHPELDLVAVSGPDQVSVTLDESQRYTIGRRAQHEVPLMHPEVSKDHAALAYRPGPGNRGEWYVCDLGSRHGTRVNGIALEPHRETPVMPGDLIGVEPWTFCLMDHARSGKNGSRLSTVDDVAMTGSTVASIQTEGSGRELAQERLRLLLRCAESLQRATTVEALAEVVLDAAIAGTGYSNAAVTGPMTPDGQIELIVGRGEIVREGDSPRMSRSLVRAAGHGVPAQLMGPGFTGSIREAVSIAEYGIQDAICVPLLVESTVAGFLYLDNRARARREHTIAANEACAYAVGIGRLASMAWSNLMRMELGRRYAFMEGELKAAADVQRCIMPEREGRHGPLSYIGQCRPGRVVSGDFFDVIPLDGDRVAIVVGDVSGKGIAASVLMTTAVGMLNGSLRKRSGGNPGDAVADLASYVASRNMSGRFVTLWLGVFDTATRLLTYIDAGHGYAYLLKSDGAIVNLNECGGAPVGAAPDGQYEPATIALEPGARVIIVSDGIIEQPGRSKSIERDQFGVERLRQRLANMKAGVDEVADVFDALEAHAGGGELADDATVVVVRW